MLWIVTVLSLSLLFGRCTQGETPVATDDRWWPASGVGQLPSGGVDDDLVEGSGSDLGQTPPGDDELDEDEEEEEPTDEDHSDTDEDYQEQNYDDPASGDPPPIVPATVIPSGSGSRSRCVEQRDAKIQHENSYRPQCTETGAFEPMQCHQFTGECWCVDAEGHDVPNSQRRHPDLPTCYVDDGRGRGPDDTDIAFVEPTTTHTPSTTSGPVVEVDRDVADHTPDVKPLPSKDWTSVILSQPLILAGLIGGAIFVLLVVVLILMFIVYRMRKKDEGSYSLDEPRQSFAYTRAKDQEFFA